jgi:hypothetical protein
MTSFISNHNFRNSLNDNFYTQLFYDTLIYIAKNRDSSVGVGWAGAEESRLQS